MKTVLDGSTALWYPYCMPQVNRNKPRRGSASESMFTIFEFQQEFPDDKTCMEYLVAQLYPGGMWCPTCKKVTKHHREAKRPSYACQYCGHHEHPLKGTVFENSATSLHLWFYAIYLMASTRCGISAKQLERELGVTYKTAWRMANKIRSLLAQDDEMFEGTVEIDEAFIGGKAKWRSSQRNLARKVQTGRGSGAQPVMGIAQRGENGARGKIAVKVVPDSSKGSLLPEAQARVLPGTMIYTDEWKPYNHLDGMGYEHSRIAHGQQVYVDGDVHTNTIEGFWSLLKRGIGGVYHSVSTQHLQSYCDEYVFRYNNRDATGRGMFDAFTSRIEKAPGLSSQSPSPIDERTQTF